MYIMQMKNTVDGMNKFDIADEKIKELDCIVIETTQNKTHWENRI